MSEFAPNNQKQEEEENKFSFINRYHRNNSNSPLRQNWEKLQKQLAEGKGDVNYLEILEKMEDPEIEVNNFPVSAQEIGQFIVKHFTRDDLKLGLINKIDLDGNMVIMYPRKDNNLGIKPDEYFIPLEDFKKHWDVLDQSTQDEVSKYIYRGHAQSNWYTEKRTKGRFFKMPIMISNQDYDIQNRALIESADLKKVGIDYLEELPVEKRREQYILGSLAHEIAHTWYTYIIERNPSTVESKWKELVDKHGNLTGYAQMYEDRNKVKDYDENFAEAVRLITTCPDYLKKQGKEEIAKFIKDIFNIR